MTLCREGTAAQPWEGARQGVNAGATQREAREAATCPHCTKAGAREDDSNPQTPEREVDIAAVGDVLGARTDRVPGGP